MSGKQNAQCVFFVLLCVFLQWEDINWVLIERAPTSNRMKLMKAHPVRTRRPANHQMTPHPHQVSQIPIIHQHKSLLKATTTSNQRPQPAAAVQTLTDYQRPREEIQNLPVQHKMQQPAPRRREAVKTAILLFQQATMCFPLLLQTQKSFLLSQTRVVEALHGLSADIRTLQRQSHLSQSRVELKYEDVVTFTTGQKESKMLLSADSRSCGSSFTFCRLIFQSCLIIQQRRLDTSYVNFIAKQCIL